jgi:hypothetical protein
MPRARRLLLSPLLILTQRQEPGVAGLATLTKRADVADTLHSHNHSTHGKKAVWRRAGSGCKIAPKSPFRVRSIYIAYGSLFSLGQPKIINRMHMDFFM